MPYRSSVSWLSSLSIHQFRCARLHAIGHFVGVDPRGDFVVARFDETFQVQFAHGIDELALLRRID